MTGDTAMEIAQPATAKHEPRVFCFPGMSYYSHSQVG